jgi:predicted ester cyclase
VENNIMRIAGLVLIGWLAWMAGTTDSLAGTPEPSVQNAALIRAYHDAMNRSDWKRALTYFSQDTKNFGDPAGRKGVGIILEDIYTTFPDFRLDVIDLVAKDDLVIVRCKSSGTHQGTGQVPVNGGLLVGVPPTHKHFEIEVIHWCAMAKLSIIGVLVTTLA